MFRAPRAFCLKCHVLIVLTAFYIGHGGAVDQQIKGISLKETVDRLLIRNVQFI